jgi:hypothetical protein
MDLNPGKNAMPGLTTQFFTEAREFRKVIKPEGDIKIGVTIDDTSVDSLHAGHTNILRPGLVLVRVEAAGANLGKYVPALHANAPAAGDVEQAVILGEYVNMTEGGAAADRQAHGFVHCIVDYDLILWDTADPVLIEALADALRDLGVGFIAAP